MVLHRTKEMLKQSRQPLIALFPTHLATIKTVTIGGVDSCKIQLRINIMTFHMVKTCLETNWDLPLKTHSVITVLADKLASMTNSQNSEALNSVVGSKNPKIRFCGGSESNDFRVAYGVAQTNLRYGYVSQTLKALNIKPGKYCTEYNNRMTAKVLQDKIGKSTVEFKRRRS